jgi:hypothetical protein
LALPSSRLPAHTAHMTLHSSLSLSRPQHCSQRSQGLNSFVSLSIAPTQLAQLHRTAPLSHNTARLLSNRRKSQHDPPGSSARMRSTARRQQRDRREQRLRTRRVSAASSTAEHRAVAIQNCTATTGGVRSCLNRNILMRRVHRCAAEPRVSQTLQALTLTRRARSLSALRTLSGYHGRVSARHASRTLPPIHSTAQHSTAR